MKERNEKNSSLHRGPNLFLSEDWFEVVRVNYGIASISLFRIDILLSSKNIWFGAKMARTECDDKIKLERYLDYCDCLQINILIVEKYLRFLWSI